MNKWFTWFTCVALATGGAAQIIGNGGLTAGIIVLILGAGITAPLIFN